MKRHVLLILLLSLVTLPSVRGDEPLNERARFRNFISDFILCGGEASSELGSDCIRAAIKKEPLSFKWMSDPDRLELLFQSSRMDAEAAPLVAKMRNTLKTHAAVFAKQIESLGAQFSEKLVLDVFTPLLGAYSSKVNKKQFEDIVDRIDPKIFKTIHVQVRGGLEKFQPNKIKSFSGLFVSVNSTTKNADARVQKLTRDLIEDYFSSLTILEKSKIISDYFRAPIDAVNAEKLRPLLQNLDPVMQKILQLFGRLMKDVSIEESVSILQSSLSPFPIEIMKAKVEERYGKPFDMIFKDYDATTMRRATTGQVLFATSVETGDRVAIKVRIPEILDAFEAAKKRLLGLKSVQNNQGITQFVLGLLGVIQAELNYLNEANYTDLSKELYTDVEKGIFPIQRIASFKAEEDLVVYGFAQGVKPTKLTKVEDLAVRSKLIRNLIDLWTETVFFKNIESPDPAFAVTTLFHGDLHPGNILIDPATERLTVLDFGNVGLFPLSERRTYIRLFLASFNSSPDELIAAIQEAYSRKGLSSEELKQLTEIGRTAWAKFSGSGRRLDSFLSRSIDELGIPVEKSVSSLMRGMAFLRIEAAQVDALLDAADPQGKIARVDIDKTMKRSFIRNLKKEFPKTLLGASDEALIDRALLGDAIKAYLKSRFLNPCLNLFRKPKIAVE